MCDPYRIKPRTARVRAVRKIVRSILKTKPSDEELAQLRAPPKKPNPGAKNIVEFNRKRQVAKDLEMHENDAAARAA